MKKTSTLLALLLITTMTACQSAPTSSNATQELKPTTTVTAAPTAGTTANQPVRARHGIVASTSPIASRVGADIMQRGGNAIDAAVAVGLALAVTWPSAGNLGGGGFMMIRRVGGDTEVIDYRERAPLAASRDMYLDKDGLPLPPLENVHQPQDELEGQRLQRSTELPVEVDIRVPGREAAAEFSFHFDSVKIRRSRPLSEQEELIEVLPCDQMSALLAEELEKHGFERKNGQLVRTADEINIAVNPDSGKTSELVRERDDVFLNLENEYEWLDDGTGFLWATERGGAWQLEHHDATGKALLLRGLCSSWR